MPNLIPVPGAETSQNPVTRGIPAIRQGTLLDTGENHGTLYGHEHPNGPYAQGSAPGRNTFLVAHQNNASGAAGTSGRAPVAVGTVIHTQERVPASQQVVNLTFPALRIAMGHQLKHRAMFDQYKNLSFFVSDPCLKLLVANEHRLNRNLDMTDQHPVSTRYGVHKHILFVCASHGHGYQKGIHVNYPEGCSTP